MPPRPGEAENRRGIHLGVNVTAVRFAEPGFPKSRGHIRVFDGSLLGRI
jgi:hypothetical protein